MVERVKANAGCQYGTQAMRLPDLGSDRNISTALIGIIMARLGFGAFLAPHHPVKEHPMLQFRRDIDLMGSVSV